MIAFIQQVMHDNTQDLFALIDAVYVAVSAIIGFFFGKKKKS